MPALRKADQYLDRPPRRRPCQTGSPGAGGRHRQVSAATSMRPSDHAGPSMAADGSKVVDHRPNDPRPNSSSSTSDASEVITAGRIHKRVGAVALTAFAPPPLIADGDASTTAVAAWAADQPCSISPAWLAGAQRRFVVEAVAACRPVWVDHAIAPFPSPDQGTADAAMEPAWLDGVHGLCTVSRCWTLHKGLTDRSDHAYNVWANPVQTCYRPERRKDLSNALRKGLALLSGSGGINWLLVGVAELDLVASLTGPTPARPHSTIVYTLVRVRPGAILTLVSWLSLDDRQTVTSPRGGTLP